MAACPSSDLRANNQAVRQVTRFYGCEPAYPEIGLIWGCYPEKNATQRNNVMTRTSSKAEAMRVSPKASADDDTLASVWPIPGAALTPPTAIDAIRRVSELQMGVSQFAAERTRKNAATLAAFVTCRTPLDFIEVWRTAAMEAVSDYAEETARILELPRK